jgi:uncharacterized membrane protein
MARKIGVLRRLHGITWVCLFAACMAASWFSYQVLLVPQPKSFSPDWYGARWIEANGGNAPVAYFRSTSNLIALPDNAFMTIAASQVFRLYVNGTFIGSNQLDFVQGMFPRAYMYDLTSSLHLGVNVVAVRVANVDEQAPLLIASVGMVDGHAVTFNGTGTGWQATMQTTQVYRPGIGNLNSWTTTAFNASSWLPSGIASRVPTSPTLTVNPLVYEQPGAVQWMSAGAGHDAYFVRQISLPFGITDVWLRLVATGTAEVYINGHLFIVWNSQPAIKHQNVVAYLSSDPAAVQYRTGLALGVYDVSPYFHPGINTIAVHVLSPGVSAAQVGLDSLNAAMSLDMLVNTWHNQSTWLNSNVGWHSSTRSVNGWEQVSTSALSWPAPVVIGRPGSSHTFYLQDSSSVRNVQVIPPVMQGEVILGSVAAVMSVWLLLSLGILRRYYSTWQDALETASLAFVPAIVCEIVLAVLTREPQIPRPFPYTWLWAMLLVSVVGFTVVVLWWNASIAQKQQQEKLRSFHKKARFVALLTPTRVGLLKRYRPSPASPKTGRHEACWYSPVCLKLWMRTHWMLVLIIVIAIPMISYNLGYEPYWQDELASYYPAMGILAHGLPIFPSGFIYTKAELYSYCLAGWMALFGTGPGVPRMLSAFEYLVSLPVLYFIGCYFFERRVAILATMMLAFSPISLVWGMQMRMYEQEQLMTMVVVYLFYRAVQEPVRSRLIYLAVASLIIDYFSHEEIFIIFPALVIYVLFASKVAGRPLPLVMYQKHWWIAAFCGAIIILLQLLSVRLTHPVILGTDQSQEPLIQFTTNNISYYVDLMFFPSALGNGTFPWITINSLLAAIGCIWARRSTDKRVKYCAFFLLISFITLIFAFTLSSDRYIYPLLPIYYLMGAYALMVMLRAMWAFACTRLVLKHPQKHSSLVVGGGYLARPIHFVAMCTVALFCISVLLAPMLPVSSYNQFISKMAGFSYHRHYPDYDAAGQYLHAHWRKGDIVIAVAPAISVLYYSGHVDYFFSVARAMYLFERNGRITDTPTGTTPLLNQADLQAVLSAHARIWIISDNGEYQAAINKVFTFPSDFHMVFEGYSSAVYFRGDSG